MSRDDARCDEALMAAYRGGQMAAFETLFDRYAPRLAAWCERGGLPTDAAEDVVQQTFLLLHRSRRDFREGEQVRPWLYTIALNVRRKYWRRRSRKPIETLESEPTDCPREPGLSIDLNRAVGRLPLGQRDVFCLRHQAQLSFAEVSAVLGISIEAAKVRAHRARVRLRLVLEESLS